MTETLRLGCGTDTRANQWNVDMVELEGVDETWDLDDTPWPWDDNRWDCIVAEHVFEHLESMSDALAECARVLDVDGRLELALPMGRDAYADATHCWGERGIPWTWRTPEFYTGREHWNVDTGLRVVDRNVSVWSVHPSQSYRAIQQWWWQRKIERYGPGEWCFSLAPMCGEFGVVFRKS